jgi:hypothetical protein
MVSPLRCCDPEEVRNYCICLSGCECECIFCDCIDADEMEEEKETIRYMKIRGGVQFFLVD